MNAQVTEMLESIKLALEAEAVPKHKSRVEIIEKSVLKPMEDELNKLKGKVYEFDSKDSAKYDRGLSEYVTITDFKVGFVEDKYTTKEDELVEVRMYVGPTKFKAGSGGYTEPVNLGQIDFPKDPDHLNLERSFPEVTRIIRRHVIGADVTSEMEAPYTKQSKYVSFSFEYPQDD
jgi:hypothetical protein